MLKFGRRKVNKQGGSYLVSLPAIWIQNHKKIKEVEISLDDDQTLRISPVREAEP